MGQVVEVDPQQLGMLADGVAAVGDGVERAAQGVARAWTLAAQGSGGAALHGAAQDGSVRWHSDLDRLGALLRDLSAATAAALASYREVEETVSLAWRMGQEGAGRRPGAVG